MGCLFMEIYPGIEQDPDRRFGKPCLKGTRIDVATILGAMAAGESMQSVRKNYQLTEEQLMDALDYAAHIAEHVPPARKEAV